MILLALHLHSLQVGIEFEGQMTLNGTEASAPDEGVRREPQKGRLPNGRTTGPAHRSSKGNWTAEGVKLALWSPKLAYYYAFLIK